jgi:hypothetical protein
MRKLNIQKHYGNLTDEERLEFVIEASKRKDREDIRKILATRSNKFNRFSGFNQPVITISRAFDDEGNQIPEEDLKTPSPVPTTDERIDMILQAAEQCDKEEIKRIITMPTEHLHIILKRSKYNGRGS